MKHAYLILAHGNFKILSVLLEMLDDERNDIFIHFDAKAKVDKSIFSVKYSKLYFVPDDKRIDIRWGQVTMTYAEFLLLNLAHQTDTYGYYHLISGVDLPIKSQDFIHEACDQSNGTIFVQFCRNKSYVDKVVKRRIKSYHLLMKYYRTNPILRRLDKYLSYLLSVLKRPDIFPWGFGSQWFSITPECLEAFLAKEEVIKKRFRFSFCGDEFIMQSFLNSMPSLLSKVYVCENEWTQNRRLIDWIRGTPYVWRSCDKEIIAASDAFFARKFDENVDMDIVYWIRDQYKNG